MEMPRAVGLEIKAMSNLFKRQLERKGHLPEDAPTGVQGMVIRFLVNNQDKKDIFQRDIESFFSMRRPTATGILQLMEKNGMILREPVPYDARLKRLVLTEKALRFHAEITRRFQEVEALALQGITPEEIDLFFRLADKVKQNLSDPDRTTPSF